MVAVDYLRAIALCMILYDHLGGLFNPGWIVKRYVDFFFAVPLNIIQDFGAFGVSLFFLISGFLFTYNGNHQNEGRKTLKKVMKIYSGCLLSFLEFYLLQRIVWCVKETYWSQFSLRQWIESMTLVGYFTGSGEVINGTTWFLIPLFMFYVLRIGYTWMQEKVKVRWNVLILEAVLAVIMLLLKVLKLSVSSWLIFVYMPVSGLILGEIFRDDTQVSILEELVLQFVNYISMTIWFWVFARQYHDSSPYFVSFIYSIALVVLFALLNDKFKKNKAVSFLCRISLSVYLVHMTFGCFLLTLCSFVHIPFTLSFIATIGAILTLSYVHMKVMDRVIK